MAFKAEEKPAAAATAKKRFIRPGSKPKPEVAIAQPVDHQERVLPQPVPMAGGVPWDELKPDSAALAQLERTDPQIVASVQEDARNKALRTMNAIRTLSPLIAQSMAQGGDDTAQAQFFVQMMTKAHDLAQDTAKHLGLDSTQLKNRWVLNVLERVFSESLAASKVSAPPLSGEHLALAVVKVAADLDLEKEEGLRGIPETQVHLALIRAFGPVLRAQNNYDFGRNRDTDVEGLTDLMLSRVAKAMRELIDPLAREEERLTLFQVLLSEAGNGLASCWDKEAKRVLGLQSGWTKVEAERQRAAFPQGFPIQEILNQFDHYFLRLIKITQQQVHPKAKGGKGKGKA